MFNAKHLASNFSIRVGIALLALTYLLATGKLAIKFELAHTDFTLLDLCKASIVSMLVYIAMCGLDRWMQKNKRHAVINAYVNQPQPDDTLIS